MALCTLPWLGFVPDNIVAAPPVAVARLADQLGLDPGVLRAYGRRAKTRTEHLRLVAKYRGWRLPAVLEFKEFDEFLLARALEHDTGCAPGTCTCPARAATPTRPPTC
ncbi:MAG: DUF4158 domain-containing protein [Pseudonocardia sp.]